MNTETIELFNKLDELQKEICTYLQDNIGKSLNGTKENDEIIIAYLHKINEIYNSSFKLLELNEVYSANCLYRVIINLGLKAIELMRNKNFLKELKEYDEKELVKLMNKAINSNLLDAKKIDSNIINLMNRFNSGNKKVKEIIDCDLAKRNNLEDLYVMYSLECEYIHGSFYKAYEDIYSNDTGIIFSKLIDVDGSLKLMISYVLKIYEKVINYINLEFNENSFDNKFNEIVNLEE